MDTLLRRRQMMVMDTAPSPTFHSRLVFDGTAYIDTDILIPENGSVVCSFGWEQTKGYQILFNAGGRVYAYINTNTSASGRCFSASYDSASVLISGTQLALGWTYNSYTFFLTPKRAGYGSNSKTFTKGSSRPESGIVIGQNAAHTGTPFTGKISGSVKIYGSDAQNCENASGFNSYTPVYNLRPCTYMGENGLWCVELDAFYGNSAGSGQLLVED